VADWWRRRAWKNCSALMDAPAEGQPGKVETTTIDDDDNNNNKGRACWSASKNTRFLQAPFQRTMFRI
jgi:hypothetical protein